jgi:[protein-PII] uridylyltransferase
VPLLRQPVSRAELSTFLEGLPRRYVLAYTPEDIAMHFQMWRELGDGGVNSQIEKRGHLHVLTLIASDRPFLFAGISGTLAAWGMNIWKAEAFANAAGIVVDTFHFTDAYKTLELNPQEAARLQKNISEVLSGTLSLETLMQGRAESHARRPPKVDVPTEIQFDDSSSTHSTLMEIIIQDRPGLLYHLSATISNAGCNIEVALVDTEGQRAVDAFYLTTGGAKLNPDVQEKLRQALLAGPQS